MIKYYYEDKNKKYLKTKVADIFEEKWEMLY